MTYRLIETGVEEAKEAILDNLKVKGGKVPVTQLRGRFYPYVREAAVEALIEEGKAVVVWTAPRMERCLCLPNWEGKAYAYHSSSECTGIELISKAVERAKQLAEQRKRDAQRVKELEEWHKAIAEKNLQEEAAFVERVLQGLNLNHNQALLVFIDRLGKRSEDERKAMVVGERTRQDTIRLQQLRHRFESRFRKPLPDELLPDYLR